MRIDKALWCYRIYKNRRLSKEACTNGKVKINGKTSKPSIDVGPGDEISIRKGAITYSYRILEIPRSRIGAKLLFQHVLDITPESERQKEIEIREMNKGFPYETGRPSKKDIRHLKQFLRQDEEE
ncbi:MAG: ribosome-associated heat shock protein Hsp15 [Patiriisocius sp.]|jgi:ribosome-associated heat shock protein Hsp15